MTVKKRGLGRGLDLLLPPEDLAQSQATGQLENIPLQWIRPGKYQPRLYFSQEAIAELAASIKEQGLLQPILLRRIDAKQYEIIAGERRWRAAQVARLHSLPAIVRSGTDEEVISISLIENIQREDLNPLEEARALQRLVDEFQFTHQQIAKRLGRSRSAVTNILRLTRLAEPVAAMLLGGEIEMGHARALLSLDISAQLSLARTVVEKGLNVRQTEALVSRYRKNPRKVSGKKNPVDEDTRRLENNLSMTLGQPVQIRHSRKGKGKVIIGYNSLDELDGLLDRMGCDKNQV